MSRKPTLSREAWLQAALSTLRDEGVHAVRVERLAEKLGVTKGSFYWHFKDREALLRAVLDYWATRLTSAIREQAAALRCGPAARLWQLRQLIDQDHAAMYDLAVRNWAAFDPVAARVLREVDRQRLAFVQSQFEEIGFAPEQAEVRARLFAYYVTAEPSIQHPEPPGPRERLAVLRHELLTGQPASAFVGNRHKSSAQNG